AEFRAGHIPGARFFDLDAASDPGSDLPHMLPTPEHFARHMTGLGISAGSRVVVYDGSGIQLSAPRLWWMLRVFGHDQVAVLDGGMRAWRDEGRPIEPGDPDPVAGAVF
ncbi:MAG: sulfurtransferase, partial [Gemmatimonadales bacterium]|nr:sulfurtransferase [Gemmatimonadales bacterium]